MERRRRSMMMAPLINYLSAVVVFLCSVTHGEALRPLIHGSTPSASAWRMMMPRNATADPNLYYPESNGVLHFSVLESHPVAEFYGGSGVFSVHRLLDIRAHQETSAAVWLGNTLQEIIEAGWHIRPDLYGDNLVHFYVTWTSGGAGCFNLKCAGFYVGEHHTSMVPGNALASSVTQMSISIRKDSPSPSADWRLYVDGVEVGWWPRKLFTRLSSHASFVSFGGRAECLRGDPHSPPMGSGHFPGDGSSSASVKKIQYLDRSGSHVDFKSGDLNVRADARECYDSILLQDDGGGEAGLNFLYGGPSGCKNYN